MCVLCSASCIAAALIFDRFGSVWRKASTVLALCVPFFCFEFDTSSSFDLAVWLFFFLVVSNKLLLLFF